MLKTAFQCFDKSGQNTNIADAAPATQVEQNSVDSSKRRKLTLTLAPFSSRKESVRQQVSPDTVPQAGTPVKNEAARYLLKQGQAEQIKPKSANENGTIDDKHIDDPELIQERARQREAGEQARLLYLQELNRLNALIQAYIAEHQSRMTIPDIPRAFINKLKPKIAKGALFLQSRTPILSITTSELSKALDPGVDETERLINEVRRTTAEGQSI